MKTVIVLAALLATFRVSSTTPYEARPDVKEGFFIEGIITEIINKFISMAARFDPIHIDNEKLEFLGYGAEIHDLIIGGFSNITVTQLKVSGILTRTLELELEAPKSTGLVKNWKADAGIFYGDGAASIEIDHFKASVKAKVNPFTFTISDLHITSFLGHADVNMSGIYNSEWLSEEVSTLLTDIIYVVNNPEIQELLSAIVEELIPYLRHLLTGIIN